MILFVCKNGNCYRLYFLKLCIHLVTMPNISWTINGNLTFQSRLETIFKCKKRWKKCFYLKITAHAAKAFVFIKKKKSNKYAKSNFQESTFILAAFPLGSEKCRPHNSTVLFWSSTLYGDIPLQSAKDGAVPLALLAGEYQGPQKHIAQQGQVGPRISSIYVPFINVLTYPNVQDFSADLSAF